MMNRRKSGNDSKLVEAILGVYFYANYESHSPRKLQHTPGAHPRQSPYPTMKGFPLQPVGKGLGVCSKGVLKQP